MPSRGVGLFEKISQGESDEDYPASGEYFGFDDRRDD